jgi:hypothetical protein
MSYSLCQNSRHSFKGLQKLINILFQIFIGTIKFVVLVVTNCTTARDVSVVVSLCKLSSAYPVSYLVLLLWYVLCVFLFHSLYRALFSVCTISQQMHYSDSLLITYYNIISVIARWFYYLYFKVLLTTTAVCIDSLTYIIQPYAH